MPLVSVIVPVYNLERYLARCLDSILAQTLRDIEVIVVDDGSTDGSAALAEGYAARDARLRVIVQGNGGAGAARNAGMAVAGGDYLLFFDGDDLCDPGMLAAMHARALATRADVVVCGSSSLDARTGEVAPYSHTVQVDDMGRVDSGESLGAGVFRSFAGWAWDKLFRREFVERNQITFHEVRTTNDARFVFVALALAERVSYVPDRLVMHRVNNMESLENTRSRSWGGTVDAVASIVGEFERRGLMDRLGPACVGWAVGHLRWHLASLAPEAQAQAMPRIREVVSSFPLDRYAAGLDEYQAACARALSQEWHDLANSYVDLSLAARDERDRLAAELARCREERDRLAAEVDEVRGSTTFRVGRAVMAVPCALRRRADARRGVSGR